MRCSRSLSSRLIPISPPLAIGLILAAGIGALPTVTRATVLASESFTINGSGGAPNGSSTSDMIMSNKTSWSGGAVGVQGASSYTPLVPAPHNPLASNVSFKFNVGSVVDSLNATYGAGNWSIANAKLTFQYTLYANNSRFGGGPGNFDIYWVGNDNWIQGSTDPVYATTASDLLAWSGSQALLDSAYFSWSTPTVTGTDSEPNWATDKTGGKQAVISYDLAFASGFVGDTTIYSYSQLIQGVETGYIDNSGGASMGVFVGCNAQASPTSSNVRRALIAFDLSAVPAKAVIQSVSLTMGMDRTSDNQSRPLSLYRLTADWGQGNAGAGGTVGVNGGGGQGNPAQQDDATWLYRYWDSSLGVSSQTQNPLTWNNPGGDFISTPSATATIGIGQNAVCSYSWTDAAIPDDQHSLLADVDYWLAHPDQDFGWVVRGDEVDPSTARRFQSSENNTTAVGEPTMDSNGVKTGLTSYADFRPYLNITYTTVPEPASLALLLLASAGLVVPRQSTHRTARSR